MNLKLILQILLVMAIISTVCICITKPTMHKSVLVYDSKYTITPEEVTVVEKTEIPVMLQPPQTETVQMTANEKIDNQITEQQQRILQYIDSTATPEQTTHNVTKTQQVQQKQTPLTSTTKQVQTQIPNTVHQRTTSAQTANSNVTTPITQTRKETKSAPVGNTRTTVIAPVGNTTTDINKHAKQPQTTTSTISTPQPKQLTAQEEAIAWNKWRSNLQNQIMKDSKLPNVPNGTIFKFSFSVDKYGKVTNVKTWSETQMYTPYAIQYIAPVIRNYQGRSILKFPSGSNRVTTDVTGGWKISTSAKYSTPQDFNDIEKVTR